MSSAAAEMTRTEKNSSASQPFIRVARQAVFDLHHRQRSGHLIDIAYRNGNARKFDDFAFNNPNYPPYAGEIDLFDLTKTSIAEGIEDTETAIIVGPGPGQIFSEKELKVLSLLPHLKKVILIDVSESFNESASASLRQALPTFKSQFAKANKIQVEQIIGDYRDSELIKKLGRPTAQTTVFCVGNLALNVVDPNLTGSPDDSVKSNLNSLSSLAGPKGKLVIGYFSQTDSERAKAAYEGLDPFIKGALGLAYTAAARSLGWSFDKPKDPYKIVDKYYDYKTEWYERSSLIAHTLKVKKPFSISISARNLDTANVILDKHRSIKDHEEGDELVIAYSHVRSPQSMQRLAEQVRLRTRSIFTGHDGAVSLHVLKADRQLQPMLGLGTK